MTIQSTQRKAVALISGGLDSMLAAKVMMEQGIQVEGINFFTGFCVEGHTHAIRQVHKKKKKRNNALWVAETLGIKLHIIDIVEEYKNIVINPKHGYGQHLNPCLDCKIFMVTKAREWMEENDFDFIITGEVVGQRPMSQRKNTMPIVAKQSEAFDRLLRPLSAKNLPPTLPEKEGWIDREQCHDFSGRSRKGQMALAKHFQIEDYAQPAGGCCFLTDENYARKLQDMWQARGDKHYELDDVMLLKVGRHLRPRPHFKMIIAREDGENNYLTGYQKMYTNMESTSHSGPLVLIDGTLEPQDITLAAQITARYCKAKPTDTVNILFQPLNGSPRTVPVHPMSLAVMDEAWHL